MNKGLRWSIVALVMMVLIAVGTSYRWTYTPLGRLDYAAAVVARIASWNTAPLQLTPSARAAGNQFTALLLPSVGMADGVLVEDREITRRDGSQLRVRLYWPDTPGPLPIYIDIHGGGWWMGDGYLAHELNSHFAERAGTIVVSVEYRLAPEHPYPAALDDCYLALEWLHSNAEEIGGDPGRIAVGGVSAGGNLAAALAIRARDKAGPPISYQVLIVPATDLSGTRQWPSYTETQDRYLLKVSELKQMISSYVPDPAVRKLSTVSPLLATDHGRLPPALIVTAQFDPLRDEGEAYARALEDAGIRVNLHREERSLHGFVGTPKKLERIYYMGADAVRRELHGVE